MHEQVAIDNDFLMHLLEINRHEDVYGLICRFFAALGVDAWMHPLVYEKETDGHINRVGERLFQNNIIKRQQFDAIWSADKSGRRYYEMMVQQIYLDFKGTPYPYANICSEWGARKSLGEVHTAVMCAFLGWNCFLSDDNDAARNLGKIMQERMTHLIKVYNRESRCKYLKSMKIEDRMGLTSSELNVLSHSRCN